MKYPFHIVSTWHYHFLGRYVSYWLIQVRNLPITQSKVSWSKFLNFLQLVAMYYVQKFKSFLCRECVLPVARVCVFPKRISGQVGRLECVGSSFSKERQIGKPLFTTWPKCQWGTGWSRSSSSSSLLLSLSSSLLLLSSTLSSSLLSSLSLFCCRRCCSFLLQFLKLNFWSALLARKTLLHYLFDVDKVSTGERSYKQSSSIN